jgi:hypothetical protein
MDDLATSIKMVVRTAKEEYGPKYVYVWHGFLSIQ